MRRTSGVKESFDRGQQSQVRLFEQFKSRNVYERNEESVDECDSIDLRNAHFHSEASVHSKYRLSRIPHDSMPSALNLQVESSHQIPPVSMTQSNGLQFPLHQKLLLSSITAAHSGSENGTITQPHSNLSIINNQKKKWIDQAKNAQGMNSIVGDIDSPNSRIDFESKQFSHLNDSKLINKKDVVSSLVAAGPDDVEPSKKSSNLVTERSPMQKSIQRRASKRLPGTGNFLSMNLAKDSTVNPGAVTQLHTQATKPFFGGFLFALKMKKTANHLVSRLQSRRYLGLRQKHLKFFNDKSIMPDKEKGVFMSSSNSHSPLDHDDLNESDFINDQSISKQCLLFLRSIYLKNISSRVKKSISKIPIFQPSHTLKLLWDFLTMICIAYFLIFFPLKIAFGIPLYYNPIPSIGLGVILLDILVFLNSGFFDKGTLVTDRFGILMHYLKQRALQDSISLLPFIIFDISDSSMNLFSDSIKVVDSVISIMFLVRLTHLTQIKKKLEERFYQRKTLTHIFSLITLLLNTLFIAHLFACIWIVVAKFKIDTHDTWMDFIKVQDDEWYVMYLYSLYFLIITMTTVGYGDIKPQNDFEYLIMIIIVLISSLVFSFSINQIGTIVKQIAEEKERVKETLQVINNYMNKKNINMNLQQQIREYLEYYLKELLINDNEMEEKIFEMLSEPLNRQLMIEANKIALKDSPIFRNNFSELTITKTVEIIDELRCTPEEVIFYEGEIDNTSIFFVQQGKVELFIHSEKSTGEIEVTSLKVFSKGSSFGEMSFFTGNPRSISIRSIDFTTLLMIKRSDFLNVVKDSPEDYENFCKIKDNILFYQKYDDLGVKCISCNSKNHFLNDCPYIHYVPDNEKVIKIHQRPVLVEREKFDVSLRLQRYRCLEEFHMIQEAANQFIMQNKEFIEDQDWYDGNAEDEEEYEFYNQYDDDDDDDDLPANDDQRFQRHVEEQLRPTDFTASDPSNMPPRHLPSGSNFDANHTNIHSTFREDSYVKQSSMIQPHVFPPPKHVKDEHHSTYVDGSVKSQHFAPTAVSLRGNNALEVEDAYQRNRVASNLGINDLALTPSGMVMNLINPNPGNIRELSSASKIRKKSASNSNLHNPTQLLNKSHTLNGEELQAAQAGISMPSPNINGNYGLSHAMSQPNAISTALMNSASIQLVQRNNSQRKSSKRKNTERTLRSTHHKRTIDSRMNIPIRTNSYHQANSNLPIERKKVKKLTVLRKGIQENQIQNTLLALQGMENILLQSKAVPNSNEFDVMKTFEIYFPHNNIDVVIFQLRKKNPHLYAKQKSFIKQNTKRLHNGLTIGSQHNHRMSKMDFVLQKFLMSEVDDDKDKESMNSRMKSFTQNTHKTPKTSYAMADHFSRYREKSERKHSYNQMENSQHKNDLGSPIPLRKKSKSMKAHSNGKQYPREDQIELFSPHEINAFDLDNPSQFQRVQVSEDGSSGASSNVKILQNFQNTNRDNTPNRNVSFQDNMNQSHLEL